MQVERMPESLIRGLFLPAHHGLHPEARRIEPDTRSIDPTLAVFAIHGVLSTLSYRSICICCCSQPGHGRMLRELKLRVILTCQKPQCNDSGSYQLTQTVSPLSEFSLP